MEDSPLLASAPLDSGPVKFTKRQRLSLGFFAAVGSLAVLAFASSSSSSTPVAPRTDNWAADAPLSGAVPAPGAIAKNVIITQADFAGMAEVKAWLNAQGIDESSDDYDQYVPAQLNVTINEALMTGEIGEDAAGGYITYGLYNGRGYAGYVVVMSMQGTLVSVFPTFKIKSGAHPDAIKLRSPNDIIWNSNAGNKFTKGAALQWSWKDGVVKSMAANQKIDTRACVFLLLRNWLLYS